MNIGIDFGSTYSTIARFNENTGVPEAVAAGEGKPASVPSLVSVPIGKDISKAFCGETVKRQFSKRTVQIFDAFKMLLIENDEEMLRSYGYTGSCSPRMVTGCFLDFLIKTAIHREGNVDAPIDNVCICVPEIWCSGGNSSNSVLNGKALDGRRVLREILFGEVLRDSKSSRIKENSIQVVTESEAASAFFARNFEIESGKAFNGYLLLIDYGGGTLDVTLTEVRSDGRGNMEIGYREGKGEGQNHPDKGGRNAIGNAGIAYIQRVVQLAINDCTEAENLEEINYGSREFKAAANDLENILTDAVHIKKIKETFEGFGDFRKFSKINDEDDEEFYGELEYDGIPIPVTYKHLYQAYHEVIEDVLSRTLKEMNDSVSKITGKDPTRPGSGNDDDLKIAIVGGFGSYYMVRKQIYDIYNINPAASSDKRIKHINASKSEQAIALGAALIASGTVKLQKVARFSIGIISDGGKHLSFGIRHHMQLEPGTPYFLCYTKGDHERVQYGMQKGAITGFAISFNDKPNVCRPMKLKRSILDKINEIPSIGVWNFGFSVDKRDVIFFHAENVDDQSQKISIELDNLDDMFEFTDTREVEINEI